MKSRLLLLATLMWGPACSSRSTLDTWEDGIPAYLQNGGAVEPEGGTDAGGNDAGSTDAGAGRDAGGNQPRGAVGDPCDGDDACQGDSAVCLQRVTFAGIVPVDFPGGYCTQTDCQDDADCPDGAGCFDAAGDTGCNKLCETDADCRQAEGYRCASIPGSPDTRTSCQPQISFGGLGF